MCGIAGIFSISDQFAALEEDVLAMRDVMDHRGPDDAGTWVDVHGRVALAHRRLAVIDTSPAGRQPMLSADGKLVLVFNGEIYNYRELRTELERSGHRFRSQTDTETILHAYTRFGPDFLSHLAGMFALALYDAARHRLVLVRDRLGVKPLYYANPQGQFLFASELKGLLRHPRIGAELDETAAVDYLHYGSTVAPSTIFDGIRKLAPAESIVVEGDGSISSRRYWTPVDDDEARRLSDIELPEAEAELLAHLRRSIAMRLRTDVPFGVFLSGGLDSSTNVALIAEAQEEPVRTFSIDPGGAASEKDHALAVARRFGTDHLEIPLSQETYAEALSAAVYHQDEPNPDWACVPTLLLARAAKAAGVTVVQLGEGADEVFHGYPEWHRARRSIELLSRSPAGGRRALAAACAPLAGQPGRRGQAAEALFEVALDGIPFRGGAIDFRRKTRARLLSPRLAGSSPSSLGYQAPRRNGSVLDAYQRLSWIELQQRLPEMLLMRIDKMTMAASVEGREPFLDHKLVEFGFALPARLKFRAGESKLVFRSAMADLLPTQIVQRPKQGFTTPIPGWLAGSLGDRIRRETFSSSLRARDVFDYAAVDDLWKRFKHGDRSQASRLWRIWMLGAFHDAHIGAAPAVAEEPAA